MHVMCITLQPVSVVLFGLSSHSLICLSLTMQYSCSPPPNISALPPLLPLPQYEYENAVIQLSSAAGEEGRGALDSINSDLHFRRITELDSLNSTLNRYLTELGDWKNRVQNMLYCDNKLTFYAGKSILKLLSKHFCHLS